MVLHRGLAIASIVSIYLCNQNNVSKKKKKKKKYGCNQKDFYLRDKQ